MMRATLQRTLGAAAAGLILAHAAFAADATADGAAGVKADLARYLGAGALTVNPAGAGYKLTVDLKAMLSGLERFGVVLDPAVYTLTATPESDGLWHVAGGGLPQLLIRHGDQATSIVTNGQTFDGTFDARIPSLTAGTGHYDSVSVGVIGRDGTTQARETTQGEQHFTASPHGDGVIDGTLTRTDAGFSQDLAIDNARMHVAMQLKSGRTQDAAAVEGLRVRALAALWAFLVAHPSVEAAKADQPALRTLLAQTLPVFDRLQQDSHLEGLSVQSPLGPFGARTFTAHLDLRGLTADGAAGLSLTADGVTIPPERLPAWSAPLVPTRIALQAGIAGFHLDGAARAIVDALDLGAADPVPQSTLNGLPALLGSRDDMVVTIGDSRLASPTLDARFSGTVRLTQPLPEIAVTIHATGLDQAIAAVQGGAAHDASAAKAIALLVLIKGYAKTEPDGTQSWTIAGERNGTLTINGIALPGASRN